MSKPFSEWWDENKHHFSWESETVARRVYDLLTAPAEPLNEVAAPEQETPPEPARELTPGDKMRANMKKGIR